MESSVNYTPKDTPEWAVNLATYRDLDPPAGRQDDNVSVVTMDEIWPVDLRKADSETGRQRRVIIVVERHPVEISDPDPDRAPSGPAS